MIMFNLDTLSVQLETIIAPCSPNIEIGPSYSSHPEMRMCTHCQQIYPCFVAECPFFRLRLRTKMRKRQSRMRFVNQMTLVSQICPDLVPCFASARLKRTVGTTSPAIGETQHLAIECRGILRAAKVESASVDGFVRADARKANHSFC